MTEDINNIINSLADNTPQIISGSKDDKVEILQQSALIKVYAHAGKGRRSLILNIIFLLFVPILFKSSTEYDIFM